MHRIRLRTETLASPAIFLFTAKIGILTMFCRYLLYHLQWLSSELCTALARAQGFCPWKMFILSKKELWSSWIFCVYLVPILEWNWSVVLRGYTTSAKPSLRNRHAAAHEIHWRCASVWGENMTSWQLLPGKKTLQRKHHFWGDLTLFFKNCDCCLPGIGQNRKKPWILLFMD